jgi:hypothetical protein
MEWKVGVGVKRKPSLSLLSDLPSHRNRSEKKRMRRGRRIGLGPRPKEKLICFQNQREINCKEHLPMGKSLPSSSASD